MSLISVRKATLDTILPQNVELAKKFAQDNEYRDAHAETIAKDMAEAYASGNVQLVNSNRIAPIIEEVLMRGWAMEFGSVRNSAMGELPMYRTRSRKNISVKEVAPNGKSLIKRYANADSTAYGSWAEISTDKIEVEIFNPLFPNAGYENEKEANQEASYAMNKDLHKRIKTVLDGGLGTLGSDVWTYKDADVVGLPTSNDITATGADAKAKIEDMLKQAIKFFTGQGKANNGEVINLHISVLDEQDIWAIAPLVQSAPYTPAQEEIFRTGTILTAYGHRFRIIPENNSIDQGYAYARVGGPAFDLFLMDMGEFGGVQQVPSEHPRRRAFVASQMVSIMQPATYKSNYCRIQFK